MKITTMKIADYVFEKVKDFSPKYKDLEIIFHDVEKDEFIPYRTMTFEKAVKKFGDYEIITKLDYDDTKTTSVILSVKQRR